MTNFKLVITISMYVLQLSWVGQFLYFLLIFTGQFFFYSWGPCPLLLLGIKRYAPYHTNIQVTTTALYFWVQENTTELRELSTDWYSRKLHTAGHIIQSTKFTWNVRNFISPCHTNHWYRVLFKVEGLWIDSKRRGTHVSSSWIPLKKMESGRGLSCVWFLWRYSWRWEPLKD